MELQKQRCQEIAKKQHKNGKTRQRKPCAEQEYALQGISQHKHGNEASDACNTANGERNEDGVQADDGRPRSDIHRKPNGNRRQKQRDPYRRADAEEHDLPSV